MAAFSSDVVTPNRYVYHYCAVSGGTTMSGIAQLMWRIVSQSDLEKLKLLVSTDDFKATAILSLSYLGRELEGDL